MKNTRCICFYLDFQQPIMLLPVALYSLEKNYAGDIHVAYGANVPEWLVAILKGHKRISTLLTTTKGSCCKTCARCHKNKAAEEGKAGLAHCCPQNHLDIPFATRVMYDCDHVFIKPLTDGIFEHVERYGLACFGLQPAQLRWSGKIKAESVAKEIKALGLPCADLLPPSIGACLGSTDVDKHLLEEWEHYINVFAHTSGPMLTAKYVDQHALSYVMWRNKIEIGTDKYSYSGQVTSQADINPPREDVVAIHFAHGRFWKRGADHIFGETFGEAIQQDFLGLQTENKRYTATQQLAKAYFTRQAGEHKTQSAAFTKALQGIQ